MERTETNTQPPAFAYVATPHSVLEQTHDPVASKDDHEEDESESQVAQDVFLAELLGLAFLIAFHGSVFLLKHVYVIALTLLSYVDNDIEKKYVTHN